MVNSAPNSSVNTPSVSANAPAGRAYAPIGQRLTQSFSAQSSGLWSPAVVRNLMTGADILTVALATSVAVSVTTTPFQALASNLLRRGCFFGDMSPARAGGFAAVRSLYGGFHGVLKQQVTRTGYLITTKDTAKDAKGRVQQETQQDQQQPTPVRVHPYGVLAAIIGGDVFATQVQDSSNRLRRGKVLPREFTLFSGHNLAEARHNLSALLRMGAGARIGASTINFAALLMLQEAIANRVPSDNPLVQKLVGAGASGAIAAAFCLPPMVWRDWAALQTTYQGGRIEPKSLKDLIVSLAQEVKSLGFSGASKKALELLKTQLPVRSAQMGLVYVVIAAVDQMLGSKPVSPHLMNLWLEHYQSPASREPSASASLPDNRSRFFSPSAQAADVTPSDKAAEDSNRPATPSK